MLEVGTCSQNNLRFIDISQLHRKFGDTLCAAVLGYQEFMGCDYTVAFCIKGKDRPSKILENTLKYEEIFDRIDLKGKINKMTVLKLESMHVWYMVVKDQHQSTKYVWSYFLKNVKKLNSNMKKFDGSQLPSC